MAIIPPILGKIVADFASLCAYFITEIRAFHIKWLEVIYTS